jgi:pyruvate,water dikinase
VTVSCAEGDTGFIYDGLLETEVTEVQRGEMPEIKTKIMMNVGNPQLAFDFCQLPNEGVGLARLEFIINNNIGVHPKAILDYPNIDADLKKAVESVARGHASRRAPSMWTRWPKAWPPLRPPSGPSRSSCACPTSRATNTAS